MDKRRRKPVIKSMEEALYELNKYATVNRAVTVKTL